jgi:hypothetical protein
LTVKYVDREVFERLLGESGVDEAATRGFARSSSMILNFRSREAGVPRARGKRRLAAAAVPAMARADLTIERASGGAVTISPSSPYRRGAFAGYMGRKRIPDGTGMLFAFPADERLSFWMKDTPTALPSPTLIRPGGSARYTSLSVQPGAGKSASRFDTRWRFRLGGLAAPGSRRRRAFSRHARGAAR